MKAWQYAQHGAPAQVVRLAVVRTPKPWPDQVQVQVEAAGGGTRLRLGARACGLTPHQAGAFAALTVLDDADAFVPPSSFTLEQHAGLTSAYQTAWFAVHLHGRVARGEAVVVHAAAGAVGRRRAPEVLAEQNARLCAQVQARALVPEASAALSRDELPNSPTTVEQGRSTGRVVLQLTAPDSSLEPHASVDPTQPGR